MRQLVYTMLISNNRASFHLWWRENLLKHRKVSKYYEKHCSLKSKVDKQDMHKLETVLVDLSWLCEVVKKYCFNDFASWICYEKETLLMLVNLLKKLTTAKKIKKLKRKYLTITNTLLLIILINFLVKYLMKDWTKQS